jgi:predicted negative regulator of RcsB-dependent stress response
VDGNISEQQQVEEIKKWLRENGTSIIAGLVIGLAAVLGWRVWDGHRHATAQQASEAYSQMINDITAGKGHVATADGEAIISRYGDTSYASFAALLLARNKLEEGDAAAASAHLQWVVTNARQPELKQLALLRLARVLLAENKIDEGLKQLAAMAPDRYVDLRADLTGDLYRAKGDLVQARRAYQEALAALDKDKQALQEPIQMKLDAIGSAPVQERTQ